MAFDRQQPDNSRCDRIMELQSRRQVIENWLSTADIPDQFVGDIQEMMAVIEAELAVLRDQLFMTRCPPANKRLDVNDRRS
jgi:hypothetical protein